MNFKACCALVIVWLVAILSVGCATLSYEPSTIVPPELVRQFRRVGGDRG